MIQTLVRNGHFWDSPLLLLFGLCIIPGGILVYAGVGKKIETPEKTEKRL
jgi:hypothetical protein